MQREVERGWVRGSGRGRRGQAGQGRAEVAELGRRFAEFRDKHPGGARIPRELRASVVAAVEQGAKLGELLRVCKLSWSQVHSWQRSDRQASAEQIGESVRVFSVEDEARGSGGVAAASVQGQELELRLGQWMVSVRLAERTGRGRACSR